MIRAGDGSVSDDGEIAELVRGERNLHGSRKPGLQCWCLLLCWEPLLCVFLSLDENYCRDEPGRMASCQQT